MFYIFLTASSISQRELFEENETEKKKYIFETIKKSLSV